LVGGSGVYCCTLDWLTTPMRTSGTRIRGLLGRVKQFKRPPSEGVHLLRFRFVPAFKWVFKWTAPQDPTAVSRPLLRMPNRPQDAVVLPVRPVLQCHYSLMCPLACVNTVYINILMFLFHVAPRCAQLACGRNRMPLRFTPERAPFGLCKYPVISIYSCPSFMLRLGVPNQHVGEA